MDNTGCISSDNITTTKGIRTKPWPYLTTTKGIRTKPWPYFMVYTTLESEYMQKSKHPNIVQLIPLSWIINIYISHKWCCFYYTKCLHHQRFVECRVIHLNSEMKWPIHNASLYLIYDASHEICEGNPSMTDEFPSQRGSGLKSIPMPCHCQIMFCPYCLHVFYDANNQLFSVFWGHYCIFGNWLHCLIPYFYYNDHIHDIHLQWTDFLLYKNNSWCIHWHSYQITSLSYLRYFHKNH